MAHSSKKDSVRMITFLGMTVMIIAVAVKAATSSVIAAAAIHVAGLACFFIIEGVEKTPDSESGLSFKRFFSDLKKPGVIPLILLMLLLTPAEMLLSKAVFGRAYVDHVLERVNLPGLDQLPLLLFNQTVSVLGEEIEFRAFFVGKGMKQLPFWSVAIVGAVMKDLICNYPERYHSFQFSVLQILPKTMTAEEVVAVEARYKKKLLSIPFGMNEN